jgi:microcystin-dependent protein
MTFWKWSQTATSNATADSSINWAEGQSPSSVNDSARAMMAAAAKYRDDVAGGIVTTGTSTAYAVSTWQGFDTLAHLSGQMIAFVPHTTSGATVTLNVDGLGAKPLRASPSVELQGETLVQGTPYVATYNNSDGAFYLQGFAGNPYQIPLGGLLPYVGSTAPNSAFALPYGQAISRTTYSTLFTLVSTAFGTGDGSTTFNLPDLRGTMIAGLDNMGGSAANRVTNAGSGITGTTIGATGGAQNVTLAQSALPNATLNVTITDPGHHHAASSGSFLISSGGSGEYGPSGTKSTAANTANASTGITATTASMNGGIAQTTVNVMPPTMILPFILRII